MMVYRVEHRIEGFGPYIPRWGELTDEENDLRRRAVSGLQGDSHPEPWEDGLGLTIGPEEFCCFVSLDLLREWFSGNSLELLEKAGYGIIPYEVDENFVRQGYQQSVFVRGEAVRGDALEPVPAQ